jgi:beta-1,4-N-acetylglucosaminyltransferase
MLAILAITASILLLLTLSILATLRLLFILQPLRGPPHPRKPGSSPTHLLAILGSGGHTAEMLAMLQGLDTHLYTHRTYVVSAGDALSAQRAKAFEDELRKGAQEAGGRQVERKGGTGEDGYGSYSIWIVPRARNIHQSAITAPFTCLRTLRVSLQLLANPPGLPRHIPRAPDVILANGPATSAIVIFAQLLLRFMDIGGRTGHERTRVVFVESLARVRRVSLSARVVRWCVDRLLVQWDELRGQGEVVGLVVVDGELDR